MSLMTTVTLPGHLTHNAPSLCILCPSALIIVSPFTTTTPPVDGVVPLHPPFVHFVPFVVFVVFHSASIRLKFQSFESLSFCQIPNSLILFLDHLLLFSFPFRTMKYHHITLTSNTITLFISCFVPSKLPHIICIICCCFKSPLNLTTSIPLCFSPRFMMNGMLLFVAMCLFVCLLSIDESDIQCNLCIQ